MFVWHQFWLKSNPSEMPRSYLHFGNHHPEEFVLVKEQSTAWLWALFQGQHCTRSCCEGEGRTQRKLRSGHLGDAVARGSAAVHPAVPVMESLPESSLHVSYFPSNLVSVGGVSGGPAQVWGIHGILRGPLVFRDLHVIKTQNRTEKLSFKGITGFSSHFNYILSDLCGTFLSLFLFHFYIAFIYLFALGLIIKKIIMGSVMHIDSDIKLWHTIKFSRRC